MQVQLLIPGPHIDKRVSLVAARSTYSRLATAGIEVREFQPTMLHAKIVTIDGVCAVVGSANLNGRSMERDDELSLVVHDPAVARRLDRDFDDDLERSELVDESRWQDPPLYRQVLDQAAAGVRRFL